MAENNVAIIEGGLKQINLAGRVAKGFNCVIKAIIKGKAKLVFLADDCDNKEYKALITGLCKTYNVKLVQGINKDILGKTLGMSYLKGDGTVRRQINCSACAVTKYPGQLSTTPAVVEFQTAFDPESVPQE